MNSATKIRARRSMAAAALTTALVLSGCGSDDSGSTDVTTDSDSGSSGKETTTVTNGWDNPDAGKMDGAPTITAPEGDAPSDLVITDLVEGTGEPLTEGQYAGVDYVGALYADGTVFDGSYGRAPFVVNVGAGGVIEGWDKGLVGMKVGGQRQLVIPPEMAYGSQGAGGSIPPDAPLIFIVELRSILTPPGEVAPIDGTPTEAVVTTEIEGTGDPSNEGSTVAFQYRVVDGATGAVIEDSWGSGSVESMELGAGVAPTPAWEEVLTGVKAGSRIRVEAPTSLFAAAEGLPETIVIVFAIVSIS